MELRQEVQAEARMTPAERHGFQQLATDNLQTALKLFTEACLGYSESEGSLTGRERDIERYAWLYRADCAFELKQYDVAARLYDEAARKYSDHHSSMHALVQIINCYDRLGETTKADIAHRNALHRLQQLPDDAFTAGDALMNRGAWEQWLQNRPPGLAMSTAGGN
jgi:tetratricopeptide (TPR) repeat protein